jgi:hypothetical protein
LVIIIRVLSFMIPAHVHYLHNSKLSLVCGCHGATCMVTAHSIA